MSYPLLLSHWTRSLLVFGFYSLFSLSVSDGVNSISLSSVQLFLPCVISTLIKIPWDFYFCFICFHVYIFHLFLFYNFYLFAEYSIFFFSFDSRECASERWSNSRRTALGLRSDNPDIGFNWCWCWLISFSHSGCNSIDFRFDGWWFIISWTFLSVLLGESGHCWNPLFQLAGALFAGSMQVVVYFGGEGLKKVYLGSVPVLAPSLSFAPPLWEELT